MLRWLHVRGIVEAAARVGTSQDARDTDGGAQFLGETGAGTASSGTIVVVFSEEDVGGSLVTGVPVVPAGAVDDAAQGGVLEHNTGVCTPWTAEVIGSVGDRVARCSGDVAVVEDIVGG